MNEKIPTNQEVLIAAITGQIDDGGASWEAWIHYHINCPYYRDDPRGLCYGELEPQRKLCVECKAEWLAAEVDE